MKKYLLLFLVVLLASVDVCAQMHYTVRVKDPNGVPLNNVKVFTFPIVSKGKGAYEEGKKDNISNKFDKKKYDMTAEGVTDPSGVCEVSAYYQGAIILDGGDCTQGVYHFSFYVIEEVQKNEFDYEINLILTGDVAKDDDAPVIIQIKDGKGYTEFAKGGKPIDLGSITKKGDLPVPKGGAAVKRHGKFSITVEKDITLAGEHARSDARFVVFPKVIFEDYKDSICYMPPVCVDGTKYQETMIRRMGFDETRDKLHGFHFDSGVKMISHQSEMITYSQEARILKGTNYHIPAVLWYEDYNGVYYKDSLLFLDGKEEEPMRFLNWEDARRQLVNIDTASYRQSPSYAPEPNSASFGIEFEPNKVDLNLRDSATVKQRDDMLRWVGGYANAKGKQLTKIEIRAYSSPEGTEKRNRELAKYRANSIENLLLSKFSSIDERKVELCFDSLDNIVSWDEVADTMLMMDDSIAHVYANEIRSLIKGHTKLDDQYKAIRNKTELYNYVRLNVLKRVRRVEIKCFVIEQRILPAKEIIERFEADSLFRLTMKPYQYYTMLCYLFDAERWDDLYDVAQRAYREMEKKYYMKQYLLNPKDTILSHKQELVPYGLAGYYYAISSMRRGIVDTQILKPYLDDGKVNNRPVINTLPFIVAQVLMYCQDEDFDRANDLIGKYNLMSYAELNGLIMFVRCLDGQYYGEENRDVREYVMSTSEMNKAVMLAAIGKYSEALSILYSDNIPQQIDAKVEYLKAICHFSIDKRRKDLNSYQGINVYDPESKPGIATTMWAAPMLKAFELDETNVKYIENDGYFNDAYRQMVLYFWKRMQDGVVMDKIVKEYDSLVKKMKETELK